MRRVHGEEEQSGEILPGLLRVLLRGSPESPRQTLSRQGPQADPSFRAAEGEAVSAPRQVPEAVLPHRPAVRLLPVRERATQEPRRRAAAGREGGTAGGQAVLTCTLFTDRTASFAVKSSYNLIYISAF